MASTFWNSISAYLNGMPIAEGIAVILGLAYLLLAAKESLWCWPCAFLSTLIYLYIFKEVSLLSEMLLQVFYLIMAIFGFYQWRNKNNKSSALKISSFTAKQHLFYIGLGTVTSVVLGYIMQQYFAAAFPYLDAFTAIFAVICTFMVTNKILENWLYWLIIDAASIYLYWQKELYFTVLLFIVYEFIVIVGYYKWKSEYKNYKTELGC